MWIELSIASISYTNTETVKNSVYAELILRKPFAIFEKVSTGNYRNENQYCPNKLIKFSSQILRYWMNCPILILKFDKKSEIYASFKKQLNNSYINANLKLSVLARYQKRGNKTKLSLSLKKMKLIKDHAEYFEKYQARIMNYINCFPLQLTYHFFVLLSSSILTYPIDIPLDLLQFFTDELEDPNKEHRLISAIESLIYREQSKIKNAKLTSQLKCIYFSQDLEQFIAKQNQKSPNKFLISKLELTPSLIKYKMRKLEQSNRIFRYLEKDLCFMINIQLRDDLGDPTFFTSPTRKRIFNEHFKNVLEDGFQLGAYHFSFLGYSNSQLKSHSFWFAYEKHIDFGIVYSYFGEFDQEKNVSKNASRRGLIFSSSTYFKEIKHIETISDVNIILNDEFDFCKSALPGKLCDFKINFTDGIGCISLDLAYEIAKQFNCSYLSAFQIRLGGIKGVLSVNPLISDQTIMVRDSMKKFESTLTDLYIIRSAKNSKGFLNRQIIVLLEHLGIESSIFLKKLETNLNYIKKLLSADMNHKEINSYKCSRFTKDILILAANSKKFKSFGVMNYLSDPFISGMTEHIFNNSLSLLKNKAQIYISKSARLIGVIDELDILKENEIFVQLVDSQNKAFYDPLNLRKIGEVVTGSTFVTKNPCLYYGDIQVCKAVDEPKLYHHVNVVVFSRKATRPVQQLISDGDLDGDVYFVCWDQDLIPKDLFWGKHPSIDYQQRQFSNNQGEVQTIASVDKKNIIEFICTYLTNDILGMLCNRHLALGDLYGLNNPLLMTLSCYQSSAVNFGKYEQSISYEQIIKKYPVKSYPDFFEKIGKKSYKSQKALGKIYRRVKEEFKLNNYIKIVNNQEMKVFYPNCITEGMGRLGLIVYKDLYIYYKNSMKSKLQQFKLYSEFEYVGGLLNLHNSRNYLESKQEIEEDFEDLKEKNKLYVDIVVVAVVEYIESLISFYSKKWNFQLNMNQTITEIEGSLFLFSNKTFEFNLIKLNDYFNKYISNYNDELLDEFRRLLTSMRKNYPKLIDHIYNCIYGCAFICGYYDHLNLEILREFVQNDTDFCEFLGTLELEQSEVLSDNSIDDESDKIDYHFEGENRSRLVYQKNVSEGEFDGIPFMIDLNSGAFDYDSENESVYPNSNSLKSNAEEQNLRENLDYEYFKYYCFKSFPWVISHEYMLGLFKQNN